MAPEQCAPDGRIGPPTDVFGLAATLYTALTGARPFPPCEDRWPQLTAPPTPPPPDAARAGRRAPSGLGLDPAVAAPAHETSPTALEPLVAALPSRTDPRPLGSAGASALVRRPLFLLVLPPSPTLSFGFGLHSTALPPARCLGALVLVLLHESARARVLELQRGRPRCTSRLWLRRRRPVRPHRWSRSRRGSSFYGAGALAIHDSLTLAAAGGRLAQLGAGVLAAVAVRRLTDNPFAIARRTRAHAAHAVGASASTARPRRSCSRRRSLLGAALARLAPEDGAG